MTKKEKPTFKTFENVSDTKFKLGDEHIFGFLSIEELEEIKGIVQWLRKNASKRSRFQWAFTIIVDGQFIEHKTIKTFMRDIASIRADRFRTTIFRNIGQGITMDFETAIKSQN